MLECPAVGWPAPTMTWTKYGGTLPRERTAMLPGALLLTSVTEADEGTYVCNARNGVGSTASCVLMLQVQGEKLGTRFTQCSSRQTRSYCKI